MECTVILKNALNWLTTSNIRMLNFYILCVLQVNAISIWAIFWRIYCDVIDVNTFGVVEFQMALWTVYDSDVMNRYIIAGIESYGLHTGNFKQDYQRKTFRFEVITGSDQTVYSVTKAIQNYAEICF